MNLRETRKKCVTFKSSSLGFIAIGKNFVLMRTLTTINKEMSVIRKTREDRKRTLRLFL